MQFNTQIFPNIIDLSSEQTKKYVGEQLVSIVRLIINDIIKAVQNDNFNYDSYTSISQKDIQSGLTGKSGIYLIINRATRRIYLGGAADLAQRKGEHNKTFKNKTLQTAMRDDLNAGSAKDFYFVPIIIFSTNNIAAPIKPIEQKMTYKQQIALFLDCFVEKPLLETYLTSNTLRALFYNMKTVGKFEKGNTFGGAPNSGSPSRPICYENYAWESIVWMEAETFNVDRKLIRAKRDNGVMFEITVEEFSNFFGMKITNAEANAFSKTKPKEYYVLLAKLFPNVAKKRVSNGEP